MIFIAAKDVTFRTDRAGNPVLATNIDYYLGVINQLFNMVPGFDPYNPDMGIDLESYRFKSGVHGERDGALEQRVSDQFRTYTDLNVSNVIAIFMDDGWKITFTLTTASTQFVALVGYKENSLSSVLREI